MRGRGPNSPAAAVGDLVYLVSERNKTHACDKYLVTSISGGYCVFRKFTRNQFRRKEYSGVPLSAVYPIVGSTLSSIHFQDSESSSDSDDELVHQDDVTLEHVLGAEGEEEEKGVVEEVAVEDVNAVEDNAGRPRRDTRAPRWHEDFVME